MNIQIQIEQLILEEMELTPGVRSRIQAAMEAELAHLVGTAGLSSELQGGGFISKLPITLEAAMSAQPEAFGKTIAQLIYARLREGRNDFNPRAV